MAGASFIGHAQRRCPPFILLQARGLPHVHMLVILETPLLAPALINRTVCAEFPNPVARPALHAAVKEFMVHGPCDIRPDFSCRTKTTDGACFRDFPKELCSTTLHGL